MADDLPAPDDPRWRRLRPRDEDSELDRAPEMASLVPPLLSLAEWRQRVPYAFAAALAWFFVFPVLLHGSYGVGSALLAGALSSWVLVGRRAPVEVEGHVLVVLVSLVVVLLLAT